MGRKSKKLLYIILFLEPVLSIIRTYTLGRVDVLRCATCSAGPLANLCPAVEDVAPEVVETITAAVSGGGGRIGGFKSYEEMKESL